MEQQHRAGRPDRRYTLGGMLPFLSVVFWSFLTITSILLFPIAVVIWALTAHGEDITAA